MYCIIPYQCANNTNIALTSYEYEQNSDYLIVYSYQSVCTSVINGYKISNNLVSSYGTETEVGSANCYGMFSRANSQLTSDRFDCYGAFSCTGSILSSIAYRATCEAFDGCSDTQFNTDSETDLSICQV